MIMSRFDWSACVVKNWIDRCLQLVTPRQSQHCNSMIVKGPFNFTFMHVKVCLYIRSYCSGKHSIPKLPKLNLLVTKLEIV